MNKKRKDAFAPQSDIHTIVDLPIEAVLEHLKELDSKIYATKIEKLDADTATFSIKIKRRNDIVMVEAQGSLRRWHGIFTRLDASVKKHSLSLRDLAGLTTALAGCGFAIILLLVSFSGMANSFAVLLWLGAFFALGFMFWGMELASTDDMKMATAIDEMMQALADKIRSGAEATIEFDGSELSLETLLSDEKYKHFRLDEDGELDTP